MIRSFAICLILTGSSTLWRQEAVPSNQKSALERLMTAIRRGDLSEAETLLKADHALANQKDSSRNAELPLHAAATQGNAEMVKVLLDYGADVNATNWQGETALHHAAGQETARALVARGAKMDLENQNKSTPLKFAAWYRRRGVVMALHQAGAKLDFESAVRLGLLAEVKAMLAKEPWLPKRPSKAIFAAVESRDPKMVKLLLEHGADPNIDYGYMNVSGPFTPLSEAGTQGNYETAKLLCEAGAVPNVSAGRNHDNLLLFCLAFREPRFTELLASSGANLTTVSHWGPNSQTALHVAASQGGMKGTSGVMRMGEPSHDESRREWAAPKVKALLKAKADPNAASVDGATPLHFALLAGNLDVAKILLEAGAKLDVYSASALGNSGEVEKFLKAQPKKIGGTDHPLGWPPLHWAVAGGQSKTVEQLIAAGADPNTLATSLEHHPAVGFTTSQRHGSSSRQGALQLAIQLGRLEVAKILLKTGAKSDGLEGETVSPLCSACREHNKEAVQLLLENGASPNLQRDEGGLPLMQALPDKSIVEMLLKKGAVAKPSTQETLLWYALPDQDSKSVVEMLIPKGAQINLNTACVLNRPEDVKKILDKDPTLADNPLGKEKGTPLEVALEAGAEEVCALLLEKKVKLKSSGRSRRGLLQTAASQGLVRIAKELLKLGLDVNAPDENKDPALHCAAEHGQVEMVKLLLEHGANPNARDGYFGDTALHVSAKQSYWRREQNVSPGVRRAVAEVLLSAGIKLDARNGRGEMTLHAAVETGDLDLVRFLVEKGADVNATDWSDRTVLDHAQDRPWIRKEPPDKDAIIIYLREHGAK